MLRKLMLGVLVACTAFAVTAGAAAAQGVHVENPGHHELESEVNIGIGLETPIGFIPALRCENDWEVDIQEDGSFVLDAAGISPHTGSSGACDTAEPCSAAVWPGQVEEVGPGFHAELTFCLENTGTGLSGIPFPVECDVEQGVVDSFHCPHVQIATDPNTGFPIVVEGEVYAHTSFGLMHD